MTTKPSKGGFDVGGCVYSNKLIAVGQLTNDC